MLSNRTRIFNQEEQAYEWLDNKADDVDIRSVYEAFLQLPFVLSASFDQHLQTVVNNEKILKLAFSAISKQNLPFPLKTAGAQCACATLQDFKVETIYLSGSVREGCDVRALSCANKSDIDVMFQLGPTCIEVGNSQSASIKDRGANSVRLQPLYTQYAGYLLLQHPKRSSCSHDDPILFSGSSARHMMDAFGASVSLGQPGQTGPAVCGKLKHLGLEASGATIDVVACLHYPRWPMEEFTRRARPHGRPPVDLVERLVQTAVFLVPTGYPGSSEHEDEWRVSFSRQEYTLLRAMGPEQRRCLLVLKYCRTLVPRAKTMVKSFYLKTTLMWLWEKQDTNYWLKNNLNATILNMIDYLLHCVREERLPCYFMSRINILAGETGETLSGISQALETMKCRLLSSILAVTSEWHQKQVLVLAPCFLKSNSYQVDLVNDKRLRQLSGEVCLLLRGLPSPFGGHGSERPVAVWTLMTLVTQVVLNSWVTHTVEHAMPEFLDAYSFSSKHDPANRQCDCSDSFECSCNVHCTE